MSDPAYLKVSCVLVLLFSAAASGQLSGKANESSRDLSKEGAVIDHMLSKVVFQSDGTSVREQRARIRVQSEAGLQQYGLIRFPYQASVEAIEVEVRVTKPNGSVMTTPPDSVQDVTSEIYRGVAFYSDLREKHVAVKGLEIGDVVEYFGRWHTNKPLAAGQFWYGYQFVTSAIVLDEQLEIDVPREREVKVKSQSIQPTMREENGRRIYTWKTSNLEIVSAEKQKEEKGYSVMRGLLPPADVLVSSFRSWEEVGRWYGALQQEKVQPSPELKAKAEELVKGLKDDDARLQAIYNYVSLHYRYVGIAFGIGRYQPHSAAEILGNQYGDCKDKHTLLAALLGAVGIRAYPALINTLAVADADVPSPGQFDHVISVVAKGNKLYWMDTTPELTPIGFLMGSLRGKPALVIMPDKIGFETTPTDTPVANKDANTVTAKLDADGTLKAHVEAVYRGDGELYFRSIFRRVPESQWKELGQRNFYGAVLGGAIDIVRASAPEKTDEPFKIEYDYTLKDFTGPDKRRFVIPLSPLSIPEVKERDMERKTPLWLSPVGDYQFESRIELPKEWTLAKLPPPLDFRESFAEFQASSEVREGVLVTKRNLVLKVDAVAPNQLKKYEAFRKAIADDHRFYIYLRPPADLVVKSNAATNSRAAVALPRFSDIWTDAEKSEFRFCLVRMSPDGQESAQQRASDTNLCGLLEEQQHWLHAHPEASRKKENREKFKKCTEEHMAQMNGSPADFHEVFDLCLSTAFDLPKPKH